MLVIPSDDSWKTPWVFPDWSISYTPLSSNSILSKSISTPWRSLTKLTQISITDKTLIPKISNLI